MAGEFQILIRTNATDVGSVLSQASTNVQRQMSGVLDRNEHRLRRAMDSYVSQMVYEDTIYSPTGRYERTEELKNSNRVSREGIKSGGNFQLVAYNFQYYSEAVHDGYHAWNTGVYIPPRPWVERAVLEVEPVFEQELAEAYERAFFAENVNIISLR
jgi:hypothetical protein